MLRFVLNRLLMALPTVVLVSITVFALIRFIPGDPAALMLGDLAQPEQVAEMRVELGLDRSIPQQFLIWVGDVLHGDLGRSIVNREEVLPLVASRFLVSA
jgi:peptide/nickel transport system permease protein